MPTTDPTTVTSPTAAQPGWAGRAAQVGMIAPTGFLAVMTLLGILTPGYHPLAHYWSELSLGPLGPIMIANFVGLGVAVLALAVAVGRTIADRPSGWIATMAVGLAGAAFVTAGVCVTDPATLVGTAHTWHGIVHAFTAVVIFFLATPIAGLAMAWRTRATRGFAVYCLTVAIGTPALLVATFFSGNLVGLTEGIVIAFVLAWLTVLATGLHRGELTIT